MNKFKKKNETKPLKLWTNFFFLFIQWGSGMGYKLKSVFYSVASRFLYLVNEICQMVHVEKFVNSIAFISQPKMYRNYSLCKYGKNIKFVQRLAFCSAVLVANGHRTFTIYIHK